MILTDLDRELAAWIAAGVADGTLPPGAARIEPGRTWRRDPDQNPASFATSIAFELAAETGRPPARLAASLARPLRRLPWVVATQPARDGYLTITVTPRALGRAAARLAASGPGAAASLSRAGTTTNGMPWPDLIASRSWRNAWQNHAAAMTSRLAQVAGADVTARTIRGERGKPGADAAAASRQPVAEAVAWYGIPAVRYGLARTSPGRVGELGRELLRPGASGPDPLYPVRQAHASADSVLRWAADLHLQPGDPADLLTSPAEQALLGLLPWLPVRVAAAAARGRPDELPFFLEAVSDAWLAVRLAAPALPFGGRAAPADPAVAGARLTLAGAVRAVLACGLTLTGADPCGGHD